MKEIKIRLDGELNLEVPDDYQIPLYLDADMRVFRNLQNDQLKSFVEDIINDHNKKPEDAYDKAMGVL